MHLPRAVKALDMRNRALLWAILLLLTVALLLYPVRIVCEYHPIQAPHIFDNLPLFAALFCVWTLVMIALAVSKADELDRLDWENLALACLFGIVFWGFWVIITPFGSYADDIYNQGHVRWILEEGTIPVGHENLAYFDFPGMHLLVSAISLITGLGVASSRMLFLLANCVIFSALLFLFFKRILKSNHLALLSLLLATVGNIVLADRLRIFMPGALGFTLLVALLLVLTKSEGDLLGTGTPNRLIVLLIFAAMVITYFPNSLLVPLILLGILVVQTLAGRGSQRISASGVTIFIVMVLGWAIYWTWHTFNNLTGFLPRMADQFLSGEFVETALRLGTSNVGGDVPFWANATRFAWWALLGLCTLLCLFNLSRAKKLTKAESTLAGGMLGVIIISLLSVFGTEEGYEFARFLLYAPLFAIPAALMYAARSGTSWRAVRLLLLAAVCFLLLPSFLSLVNTVSTDAIYASDVSAGTFLQSHTRDKGTSHVVFGISSDSIMLPRSYIPNAEVERVPWDVVYASNKDEVWDDISQLLISFAEPSGAATTQKLLIVNHKSRMPYLHLLGIPLDDPAWAEMTRILSANSRVYDNGELEMYVPG